MKNFSGTDLPIVFLNILVTTTLNWRHILFELTDQLAEGILYVAYRKYQFMYQMLLLR